MLQYSKRGSGKYFLQVWIACCCILLSGAGSPQSDVFPVPAALQQQLSDYRQQDDLAGWIYAQVQWVSEERATRAALLKEATTAAWRQPKTQEEQQAWLDLLMNEGHAQLVSGNIVYSTDAYRAALLWAGAHSQIVDDELVLEYILKPLGNNYTRLGDYEQALFIHSKALKTAIALNDKKAIAATYSNLATTVSAMGHPEQSVQYCREGMKMLDHTQPLYGLLLCEQADALFALKQEDAARSTIQQGIKILENDPTCDVGTPYWLLMAYQQAGDMLLVQPAKALQLYNKALALQGKLVQQNKGIRVRERAKLFYRLGRLAAQQKQYKIAEERLLECLELLLPGVTWSSVDASDLYGENTLVDVLFTQAVISREQYRVEDAMRLFTLCFATEKKLRKEYVTANSRERSVKESRRRYETAIETAYNVWLETGQPLYRMYVLQFMESGKAQLLQEEVQWQQYGANNAADSIAARIRLLEKALVYYERNRQEKGIQSKPDSIAAKQQRKTEWELADLRKQYSTQTTQQYDTVQTSDAILLKTVLQKGQIARSFFTGEHAVYCVEADSAGILFAEKLPFTASAGDSIGQFVQQYFQSGPGAMLNHPRSYYTHAFTIYHWLSGTHPLQENRQYIILPDGVLNQLPVEALVTTPGYTESVGQWPFVIRQSAISYAYSLQTLWQQCRLPVTGKGITGLFIAEHPKQQSALNAVWKEQEAMSKIISSGKWLFNEQATAAAFRNALSENTVIHISTHAFAGKDSTELPHIRLYDTPFYLFELKTGQQHPALVVLSACRTGDGRLITGEGVQSLARAFTAAGTHAVIAGWWNVHDETAAVLVKDFYASLLQQPDAATALRQAKLNWLQNKEVAYLHKLPYYWAALNYHGQPVPALNTDWATPSTTSYKWLLGIGAALLVLALVLVAKRSKKKKM